MKTSVITTPSIASKDTQESVMDMTAKGMDMAAFFLRDKIYSDKVLACVREYICNALDEHSKHNIDRPVEVKTTIEDDGTSKWSVRDYAKGLDDDGVRYIFGRYFESTKSGCNSSIGGFGIGSKAFHCFTDTFYIVSYFEGTKTTYACILGGSDSGVPIGKVYELDKENTTETGIEVWADISKDSWGFETKTVTFIEDLPEHTNIQFTSGRSQQVTLPAKHATTNDLGDNIKITGYGDVSSYNYGQWGYDNRQFRIRMGGVVYATRSFQNSFCLDVVVDVPIGTFDIPISRETLETTDKNNEAYKLIDKKIRELYDDECKSMVTTPRCIKAAIIACDTYRASKIPGTFFVHSRRDIYKKSNEFLAGIHWYDKDHTLTHPPVCGINKKLKVFVFPNIKNTANWHTRLIKFLKSTVDYNGYIGINENRDSLIEYEAQSNPIFEDADFSKVEFVRVKQMGLPALPKKPKGDASTRQYAVYDERGKNVGYYTPTEWKEKLESDLDITFTSVTDLITDPATKHQTIRSFTFDDDLPTSPYGRHRSTSFVDPLYFFRSEKFKDGLVELGFLKNDDKLLVDYETERQKVVAAKEERRQALSNVSHNYPFIENKLVLDRIASTGLNRISNMLNRIKHEDSLRGKIFKSFEDMPYYNKPKYTREEIRKILKMKG